MPDDRQGKPVSPVHRIAEAFGGFRALARALGLKPGTVYHWVTTGHVPAQHQDQVLIEAHRLGLGLGPEAFFDADMLASLAPVPSLPPRKPARGRIKAQS